jgi:hypothetical protein
VAIKAHIFQLLLDAGTDEPRNGSIPVMNLIQANHQRRSLTANNTVSKIGNYPHLTHRFIYVPAIRRFSSNFSCSICCGFISQQVVKKNPQQIHNKSNKRSLCFDVTG